MQALAQAIRALKKTPGLSLLVVLILAIGIGANTSVFTLINAALLKPLPYRDAAHLMSVSTIDRSGGTTNGCLSYPHFQLLAGRSRSFSEIAAFTNETFSVSTGAAEPIESQAARVSWNFFAVLGVAPAIGRAFTAEEGNAGAKPVVMISNAFWRQRFHGNPSVIGKLIDLDSKPYTIIGVVPPSFQFGLLGDDINIWTPHIDELNLASTQQIQGGTCYLDSVARLAPGISIEQAQAEMKVLDRVYVRDFAKMGDADPKRPVEVTLLKSKLVGNFRSIFVVLAAAVGLVAFIACANAAGLLLTRVLRRRREVAIRIAMGAARKQLLSQFLTESVTLALLGGIVGVILSLAATRLLVRLAGDTLPRMAELPAGIDLVVLAFAFALSILCGVLCGLAPALQFSAANVSANLREEGRGTAGARSRNFSRNLLVVGQIAITLILLVAAGLLIRSFILLETQAPGFNSRNVLTMSIALPPSKYVKPEQMTGFFDQLVRRVRTLPSVEAAAVSSALPINVARLTPIWVEGQPQQPLPERPIIIVQAYTAGYLRVMQIPLKRGRFFNDFDRRDSLPVTVVNQSFVKRFFPGENPIGKHVWVGRRPTPAQIVGVIGDIKNVGLAVDPQPEFDLPFAQLPWGRMNLIVRSAVDSKTLTSAVRAELGKLDRDLPITDVRTMDELLAAASTQPRLLMSLLAGFAGFAFVLALVGLYATISYSVAQRTQEMGVRIALGATRGDLLRLVLGYGAAVTCAGIFIGLLCLLMLTGAMEKLVYGISTTDPLTFCVTPALFLACALLASYIPARRAMRVDVLDVLRH